MPVPTPTAITEAFGATQVPPYINLPIPKTTATPGAASFDAGFPALTMTAPTSGGVPPSGADVNGILNMVSAYCAALQAGQMPPTFNSSVASAIAGYAIGAVLAKANGAGLWLNTTAANSTNPDTGGAGWYSVGSGLHATIAPSSGTHADNALPGVFDYFLDVDTTAGAITLNGFVAQTDGQRVTLSNTGANPLTIGALAGTAANQIRASSSTTLLQNDSQTIQYSKAIGKWIIT